MKRWQICTCSVVLLLAGWTGNDLLTGKGLRIFNEEGKSMVSLNTDAVGSGEISVFDVNGKEVFGIHAGRIISRDFEDRLKTLETKMAAVASQPAANSGQQTSPTVHNVIVPVKQPASLGRQPVLKVTIIEAEPLAPEPHYSGTKFRVTFRFTNVAGYDISNVAGLCSGGDETQCAHFELRNLDRGKSDLGTLTIGSPDKTLNGIELRISECRSEDSPAAGTKRP